LTAMKTRIRLIVSFLMVSAVLVVAACSSSAPSSDTLVTTPDTDAIVQAVLAEVESRLAGDAAATETGPGPDELAAAVLDEVEARLAQQAPTPVPSVDANAIASEVLAQVESALAQKSTIVPASYDNAVSLQEVLINLYQRANPAVVYIIVPSGSGSGFVYSSEGYIVTNNHVVEGAGSYEVVFANGERQSAQLVGADADSDLAVIRVDELPIGVEPLPLALADSVQVGQFVVAIGNPFGEQGSMSLGIVSGLDRSLRSQRGASTFGSSYSLPEVIQTDAPINPGNSGGPLLNLDGQVVGVNSAIASTTGTNSGVGFSIPVAAVRQVVPSLIADGAYAYSYLGVGIDDEISLSDQSSYDLPQVQGAYVVSVTSGGPADKAGLIAADPNTGRGGDLIVKIDDWQVDDFSDLNSYLVFHTTVGQTIQVTVLRDGEPMVLPLTLGARP
jgi:S1-C subfamily serine protease